MASVRFSDAGPLHGDPAFDQRDARRVSAAHPAFEAAFQAHRPRGASWQRLRTARQFSVYKNCPLPTPEDRLFFILTYLKTYSLQVVQGRLFGMGQSKANQWIHVLLPASSRRCVPVAMPLPAPSPHYARGSGLGG